MWGYVNLNTCEWDVQKDFLFLNKPVSSKERKSVRLSLKKEITANLLVENLFDIYEFP